MGARVIVTRPQREALRWVAQLQDLGVDAEALPLIDIAPPPDPAAVAAAWHRLPHCHSVMFVSGNAVEFFFAQRPRSAAWACADGRPGPRAWATGSGTVRALRLAGIDAALIDAPDAAAAQFDSEALWQVVAPTLPTGVQVLIVRGADADGQSAGRPWLTERLRAAGVAVQLLVAYLRCEPVWDAASATRARAAATDGSVWLFSSSEAVLHLRQLLPLQDWSRARAVATHPRIAQTVRDAGFGVVCMSRPGLSEIVASIESCR